MSRAREKGGKVPSEAERAEIAEVLEQRLLAIEGKVIGGLVARSHVGADGQRYWRVEKVS